jgi:glutathione S-transferase
MRLYHQPRSRSARVLWLLEELGTPFDLTLISREDKQTPEYLRLHPLGRAPVIEEDGGPVFESAAICLHLADLNPDAALIAAPGSHERALHYQWSFFAMTELEAPLVDVARQLWSDGGEPNVDIVDAARARFARAATAAEAALGGSDFLVADRFSVADLLVGAVLGFARTAELAELPAGLVPYVDRLEERPARQRANAVKA